MNRKTRLIIAVAAGFFLGGCIEGKQEIGQEVKVTEAGPRITGMQISAIIAQPDAYRDREVIVSGKVLPGLAFEFISEQPYLIIQEESLLWVITTGTSPPEGKFVTVRGTIASPYQIKGRSYQLVLLEEERL